MFSVERPFQESSITVDFTPRARSQQTAYTFMEEWFTKEVFQNVIESQIRHNLNEDLLQFHRICSDKRKVSCHSDSETIAVASTSNEWHLQKWQSSTE